MNDPRRVLERYLQARFGDLEGLSIRGLEKLRDGWESDNYLLTFEHGAPPVCTDWVWRVYSGVGSPAKAMREFTSMKKLLSAGYPVPRVFLLETEHSPVNRPFVMMEYIPGDMMWRLLDTASADRQEQLIDQFCRLLAQLHALDWRQFDANLPAGDLFFYIDRWLDRARRTLQEFPDVDAFPFLGWVADRRGLFACARPSPVHQDFHPGNVLIKADNSALVIDWTNFDITDPRFDLGWTLVLAHAYGPPGWRDQILRGYQRHAGKPVEQIEGFEAIGCAQRLLHLAVSLTQGAQRMGMNAQATDAMRADMEPHRRVHRRFVELTGLRVGTFCSLFGTIREP